LRANAAKSVVEQQHAEFLAVVVLSSRQFLQLGLSLIVATTIVQNSVAAAAATTSLGSDGSNQLNLGRLNTIIWVQS
jgi:hypothetical protein